MEKDVESIVKTIKRANEEKYNLKENYNKFKELYGEDTTVVRFIKFNLERPNQDLEESKSHQTELIEEREKIENELKELKEKIEKAKKIGRQLVKEITQNEKNNVPKGEKEKIKYKRANYLSTVVKELNSKIENKEDLLKGIGESLEILKNYENEKQDKLIQEALNKLYPKGNETEDNDWKKEYEKLEKEYYKNVASKQQPNQDSGVQNDSHGNLKSKFKSLGTSINKICTNLFNKFTKRKVYPVEQETNMSSETQKHKRDRKQKIQMPTVDDDTIKKLEEVARAAVEERQNNEPSNIEKSGFDK